MQKYAVYVGYIFCEFACTRKICTGDFAVVTLTVRAQAASESLRGSSDSNSATQVPVAWARPGPS